jgi:hypothetical protein
VKYLGHEATEDFWHCNLWEWAVDMVVNPLLAPHFVWDACELSKFNGEEFVRFIHEPWTADRLWEVQVFQYFLFQLWFAYSNAVQTARSGRETVWVHPLNIIVLYAQRDSYQLGFLLERCDRCSNPRFPHHY